MQNDNIPPTFLCHYAVEYRLSIDFFDKYRDNIVADVSDKVNNSYLQSQGQVEGTRSYGLVVDLAVSYYKTLSK